MKSKEVLITGSSGFVGTNLSQYLLHKNIKLQSVSLRGDNWEGQFIGKSYVAYIHLAGIAHDIANVNDDIIYYQVNYELTKKVFQFFLKDENAKTFIFFSSIKALADQPEGELAEDMTPTPKTAYGKSKQLAEDYLLKNIPANKKVFIIRPCMIHGPGNKGNMNLLIKWVKFRLPWVFAAFKNKRSYCSISNLNFTVEKLLENSIDSGIYHLADDGYLSTKELVKLIEKATSKRTLHLPIPSSFISIFAKFGDQLRLPFNSSVLNKITGDYCVSNQKLKVALGINKFPTTLEEGLLDTLTNNSND